MKIKGVIIPGLSMEKSELPDIPGYVRLQNPEVNDGVVLGDDYTIEDAARIHADTIQSLDKADEFHVKGMSMGGMMTSVLASTFRNLMPSNTKFYFCVTSANLKSNPSITKAMLDDWMTVKPGDYEGFKRTLRPFFGKTCVAKFPEKCEAWYQYRAKGENMQSPKAFMKQVNAVLHFQGERYYKQVDPRECQFIHGAEDEVFDSSHVEDLQNLVPDAKHEIIEGIGHMINIEMPSLFGKFEHGS